MKTTTDKASDGDSMTTKLKLKRIRPGYYVTSDGSHEIIQGSDCCSWHGMWLVRETCTHGWYSDPIPTLRDAKAALVASLNAQKVGA